MAWKQSSHKIKTKDQTYNAITKNILNLTFEWLDQNVTHFRQNLAKKIKEKKCGKEIRQSCIVFKPHLATRKKTFDVKYNCHNN
jgi:hypothetical protein